MIKRNRTLEELEDLELELLEKEEVSDHPNYAEQIDIYEEMYHIVKKQVRKKEQDQNYLDYISRKLLNKLIKYGTYLKMKYQKDDHTAIRSLEKALKFDPHNPIVAYRLGFLSYKHRKYHKALQNFQLALEHQPYYTKTEYLLNEQQILNAHVYLTNSALYIAKQSHEQMMNLKTESIEALSTYEFSSLYNSLLDNENYLEKHGFYKVTKDGKTTCSKTDCDQIMDNAPPTNTVLLYFSDRTIRLYYNQEEIEISQRMGDILRYLLMRSSQEEPATRISLFHYFPRARTEGEVKKNTFIKTISRVTDELEKCEIPPVVHTKNFRNETGYYYDGSIPFIIMYRVDEETNM
jgi:tetratricopeptide (TPR) repeat protein